MHSSHAAFETALSSCTSRQEASDTPLHSYKLLFLHDLLTWCIWFIDQNLGVQVQGAARRAEGSTWRDRPPAGAYGWHGSACWSERCTQGVCVSSSNPNNIGTLDFQRHKDVLHADALRLCVYAFMGGAFHRHNIFKQTVDLTNASFCGSLISILCPWYRCIYAGKAPVPSGPCALFLKHQFVNMSRKYKLWKKLLSLHNSSFMRLAPSQKTSSSSKWSVLYHIKHLLYVDSDCACCAWAQIWW